MSKISFADILSGFSTASALNQNFKDLESEFQDKVLYRDNPAGEPNQMENDLDMNSNHILNATTDLSSPTSLLNVTTADGRYFRLINKGPAAEAGTKNSVEIDFDDIQLVGDEPTPGNSKYYGTDTNGNRGFFDILTSSSIAQWGNITGTLSNQTDLQSALDTKLDTSVQASEIPEITWHGQAIASDVTIPANQNAASFGPTMSINTGVTVTVGSGSFWSIVEGQVV